MSDRFVECGAFSVGCVAEDAGKAAAVFFDDGIDLLDREVCRVVSPWWDVLVWSGSAGGDRIRRGC
jgi:hypothetical protein